MAAVTLDNMIGAFKVIYNIANLDGPSYDDDEIVEFLNLSQMTLVSELHKDRDFEMLREIMVTETINAVDDTDISCMHYAAPTEEFYRHIDCKVKITRATFKPTLTTGGEYVDTRPILKHQAGVFLSNSLNKPILLVPVVFMDDSKYVVILDEESTMVETNGFYLEYLRKPTSMEVGTPDVPCELNPFLHERIVNKAVELAKKVFNPREAIESAQADQLIANER